MLLRASVVGRGTNVRLPHTLALPTNTPGTVRISPANHHASGRVDIFRAKATQPSTFLLLERRDILGLGGLLAPAPHLKPVIPPEFAHHTVLVRHVHEKQRRNLRAETGRVSWFRESEFKLGDSRPETTETIRFYGGGLLLVKSPMILQGYAFCFSWV